jgi:small subunit ribosomal protein S2
LTNFETVRRSAKRLQEQERMKQSGVFASLSKKEGLRREKEIRRLGKSLDGIKNMSRLPDVLFVVDPVQEITAVTESRRMEIPVVSICDTNCDPDLIDYPMPGNDDAIRSVRLFCKLVADTILEGRESSKPKDPLVSEDVVLEQEILLTDGVESGSLAAGTTPAGN